MTFVVHFGLLARHFASPASWSAAAHFAGFAILYPAALGGDLFTFVAAAAGARHPRRFGWVAFILIIAFQLRIGAITYGAMPWPNSPSITLTVVIRPTAWCIIWTFAQAVFAAALASLLLLHLISGYLLTLYHPIACTLWLIASVRGWHQ